MEGMLTLMILTSLLMAGGVMAHEADVEPRTVPSKGKCEIGKEGLKPAGFLFTNDTNYSSDFNFHNKTLFLKEQIKRLVECIEVGVSFLKTEPSCKGFSLPFPETLHHLHLHDSGGGKQKFVFEYNGSRGYNESCLGDDYKFDFLRRLYDAGCVGYEEKIGYLDSFSCDARKNLECRLVGQEEERKFAEQATPIFRCRCPDYDKHQSSLDNERRDKGYYDEKREICVLKVGKKCTITAIGKDERWVWKDFDWDEDGDGEPDEEGIDVVDFRPIPEIYPCVTNAFCYTNDSRGLLLDGIHHNRCVCIQKYFQTNDGECVEGWEEHNYTGVAFAMAMIVLCTTVFFANALLNGH